MIATDEAVQHYRKLLLISPGFIQLCKGFLRGLINGEVYNRTKKSASKQAT